MKALASSVIATGLMLVAHASVNARDDIRTVVLSGAPVPGTLLQFGNLSSVYPQIDDLGRVSFATSVFSDCRSTPSCISLFQERSVDDLELLTSVGDIPPGGPIDARTTYINLIGRNSNGRVAYLAGFESDSTAVRNFGIYSNGEGGQIVPVVLTGDQLTDATRSFALNDVDLLSFGDAGHVALLGHLGGPGVDASNDQAYYTGTSRGTLSLIARTGQRLPAVSENASLARFSRRSVPINDHSQIAFAGHTVGPDVSIENDMALYVGDERGIRLIAREGERPPSLSQDWRFSSTTRGALSFNDLHINNEGNVTFLAYLSDQSEAISNQNGIFSEVAGRGLEMIVRSDQQAPDAEPGVTFGQIAYGTDYNNLGDFVFRTSLDRSIIGGANVSAIYTHKTKEGLKALAHGGDPAPDLRGEVSFESFLGADINNHGQVAFRGGLAGPGLDRFSNDAIFASDAVGNLRLIAHEGEFIDVSDSPSVVDLRKITRLDYFTGLGGSINDRGEIVFLAGFADGSTGILVSSRVVIIPEPSSLLLICVAIVHCFLIGVDLRRRSQGCG